MATKRSSQLPATIDSKVAVSTIRSKRVGLLNLVKHCLPSLANSLLARNIITEDVNDIACNANKGKSERAGALLDCIENRIKAKPSDFTEVIQVLESDLYLESFAEELVNAYNEKLPPRPAQHPTQPPRTSFTPQGPQVAERTEVIKTRTISHASAPQSVKRRQRDPKFDIIIMDEIDATKLSKNDSSITKDDLSDVTQMIKDLTPKQVQNLGVALGLYYSTVCGMLNIKTEMVNSWLIGEDNVLSKGGDPTWRSFAEGCAVENLWGHVQAIKEKTTPMKGPATIRASHVPPAPLSRMSQQTTPTKTAMPVLPAPDDSHFSSDDSPAEDLQLSGKNGRKQDSDRKQKSKRHRKQDSVLFCVIFTVGIGVAIGISYMLLYYNKPPVSPEEESTSADKSPSASPELQQPRGKEACTEIESFKDLETVLGKVSNIPFEKMCNYLDISDQACNELKNNRNLNAFTLAKEYTEQSQRACWEEIVRLLCKDFKKGRLALEVAEEHGILLSKYCS